MQEFGTIPGLAASILGGARAGGGRLGGYPQPPAQQQQAAPVKCPRCHSTDTKFCYYNNYNLTQPRHFCKSCRRYWTKGGVLRNVPVGGGCRKPKRSSSSSSKLSAGAAHHKEPYPRRPSAADASTSAVFPNSTLLASRPDPNPNPNPTRSFDSAMAMGAPLVHATAIYADATAPAAAGSFTSLISPGSAPAILERSSFSDPPPLPLRPHPSAAEGVGTQPGLMDQAAVAGMDWPGASVYPVLFDLSAAVDPAAYWSHGHWGDADPALHLS